VSIVSCAGRTSRVFSLPLCPSIENGHETVGDYNRISANRSPFTSLQELVSTRPEVPLSASTSMNKIRRMTPSVKETSF
jgi:hypothetical protein